MSEFILSANTAFRYSLPGGLLVYAIIILDAGVFCLNNEEYSAVLSNWWVSTDYENCQL